MRAKLYLLIPFLMLPVCCAKELQTPSGGEFLEAEMEQLQGQTKADVQDAGSFTWNAADRIAVHYVSGNPASASYSQATLKSGAGNYTAVFTANSSGVRNGYAVYPYEAADGDFPGIGTSTLRVRLPERYSVDISAPLSVNSFNPMVAANAPGQKLLFKHVGAMFRLKLSGVPNGTKSITVSTGKNIAGPFRVDLSSPDAPFISVSSSESVEDYTTLTFELSATVSSGVPSAVTLNVPVPVGLYSNLCITARDAAGKELACINAGTDRYLDRGRIRLLEFDFSGSRRLASFTVNPADIPVCGRVTLPLSITQIAASGGTETANAYTVSVFSISDRSVVSVALSGASVNVTGLREGEAIIRLLAQKGEDKIYADVPVSVKPAYLDIYGHSSYLYKARSTEFKARLMFGSQDVSYNGLKYSWSIVEGGTLATLTSSGSSAVLRSGINAGTVKLRCRLSPTDPDDPALSLAEEVEIEIIDPPHGTTGGLFSVSKTHGTEITQVCFARGNLYLQKSDGRYYIFDNQWDAYNGVVTHEAPEDAEKMDCLDPMTVVNEFGNYRTSSHIWIDGKETSNWFMLSVSQATYLLQTRKCSTVGGVANARFVVAKVGDCFGVILFPDVFTWPEELPVPVGINDIRSAAVDLATEGPEGVPADNCFSEQEWTDYLSPTGAVFLPGMASAPAFFSYDRYTDAGITATFKRWHGQNRAAYYTDPEKVGAVYGAQDTNAYYQMYHCYYVNEGYMYFCAQHQTNNTYYVSDATGAQSYMVIGPNGNGYNRRMDYVRYFHLRPVRYEYNKVVN